MTEPSWWIRALTTELSRPVIARMIARQFKPMENERFITSTLNKKDAENFASEKQQKMRKRHGFNLYRLLMTLSIALLLLPLSGRASEYCLYPLCQIIGFSDTHFTRLIVIG